MIFLIPLVTLICIAIKLTSEGPILHWSHRIGRGKAAFAMPKFRTMLVDAPIIPSHLLKSPAKYITPIGKILRETSLDEVPQLWSILLGNMSLVGPRPALFNQGDLIALRTQFGVDELRPGLTGWAQVNGRDELSIPIKVKFDVEYLQKKSFWFDMRILGLTFLRVIYRVGVSH